MSGKDVLCKLVVKMCFVFLSRFSRFSDIHPVGTSFPPQKMAFHYDFVDRSCVHLFSYVERSVFRFHFFYPPFFLSFLCREYREPPSLVVRARPQRPPHRPRQPQPQVIPGRRWRGRAASAQAHRHRGHSLATPGHGRHEKCKQQPHSHSANTPSLALCLPEAEWTEVLGFLPLCPQVCPLLQVRQHLRRRLDQWRRHSQPEEEGPAGVRLIQE